MSYYGGSATITRPLKLELYHLRAQKDHGGILGHEFANGSLFAHAAYSLALPMSGKIYL